MNSKWDKVLEFLWKNSRFTSYFYQSVRFEKDETIPTIVLTIWSYKAVLFYNENFIQTLKTDELVGLLVHEMLHVIFSHNHRAIKNENPHLQNIAQDMVINSYIKKKERSFFSKKIRHDREVVTLKLPTGLPVIPDEFFRKTDIKDPSWEEVYQWLKTNGPEILQDFTEALKDNFQPGEPFKKNGSPLDNSSRKIPSENDDEAKPDSDGQSMDNIYVFKDSKGEAIPSGAHRLNYDAGKKQLESNLKNVMTLAKQDESAMNERFFIEINSIIDKASKVEINPFIKKIKTITRQLNTSSDWEYSYGRFNRRYFAEGIYSAGRRLKNEKVIIVAVDVSASMVMRPESLETAFGAVESLLSEYSVHLVCIDETVFIPEKNKDILIPDKKSKGSYMYKKGDWKYIRSGNCGTTFFAPLFNDYLKNHKEMVIVITDGEIYDLGALKKYPRTLWLIPSGCQQNFSAPFGVSAEINPD